MALDSSPPNVPDHVPRNLYWDHNLIEFTEELEDPYVSGARLHDGPDIFWARDVGFGQPSWVLTRHALMEEAYLDTARFSSADIMGLNEILGVSWRINPIEFDPPLHTLYRQILNPYFTPRAVNAFDAEVRATCNALITEFEHRGACEYVNEFAIKFPNYIFLSLMGMPHAMLPQFSAWERALWHSADPAVRTPAARAILHYLETFVEEQRKAPSTDVMRGIFAARIDGRPLDQGEILGMCYLLYVAGLDTVYSSLGWQMRYLAGDPCLQERLAAHPEDIPRAVEELLRAFSVVSSSRKITRDLEFHGVQMRKGDFIFLPTYLASRDPRAYQNPHVIDIDRRPPRALAFATGPHICLGMHFARRELRIVMETFLRRFKNIRIQDGKTYKFHSGGAVVGVDYLPITWERA
jgi:cytochrome P450